MQEGNEACQVFVKMSTITLDSNLCFMDASCKIRPKNAPPQSLNHRRVYSNSTGDSSTQYFVSKDGILNALGCIHIEEEMVFYPESKSMKIRYLGRSFRS